MKTLIIGQAPSRETVGKPAFSGKSGPKFAELLGVAHEDLWSTFDVVNVIDFFPGQSKDPTKRGDAFPYFEAKKRAEAMRPALGGRTVVLVGKNVARAFSWPSIEFFDWKTDAADEGYFKFCVVPHPSGISHYYNDPKNFERAKAFMRSIPR
jgi:uracil-DNA glycosylase